MLMYATIYSYNSYSLAVASCLVCTVCTFSLARPCLHIYIYSVVPACMYTVGIVVRYHIIVILRTIVAMVWYHILGSENPSQLSSGWIRPRQPMCL